MFPKPETNDWFMSKSFILIFLLLLFSLKYLKLKLFFSGSGPSFINEV